MENRYDKYKDSGIEWIGEIPEHWEVRRMKNVCSTNNASLSDKTSEEFEFDYVDIGSVSFELGIHKTEKYTFQNAPSRARKIARFGDIIVSTVRTYLRAIDIINSEEKEKYIYSTGFAILSPLKNILSEFMIYICRSEYFTNQVSIYSTGINYPSINDTALKMINIVIPTLSEQQSIATYLDQKCGEIDELITLQEEMITKLQSYKQSVITEAVTKGLDKNIPLKDSGVEWIGEIPEHWVCTVFKKFLSEPMQYGANEPAEECNYNDPRYIRITDIKDDGTLRDDTFKSLPFEKAQEYMLTKGDLLFARSGATVGKTFLYKEDYAACFAGYLIKARCNKNDLLPNFVFYYTLSNVYQNWKNSIFIQSTIQNIGADKYSVMPIIVPPLSEQQFIADYLDRKCGEIDKLISIKQQKIEKLKDYKKSLIFECVTGKRKVC